MKLIALLCTALLSIGTSQAFAQAGVSVYPVRAVFPSDAVKSNDLFMMLSRRTAPERMSCTGETFEKKFRQYFPHAAATINDSNKYSTFAAFLQIPRVSLYRIQKTDKLVDLYLPVTVSINFANMVTGESLYSSTRTPTTASSRRCPAGTNPVKMIRGSSTCTAKTYNDLLGVVLKQAKASFTPSTINAKVGSEWNGNYILDRGMDAGMVKGDIIVDQHKNQLSVVHAAHKYSVAQSLLGAPKKDSVFSKYSNESMDELKNEGMRPLMHG